MIKFWGSGTNSYSGCHGSYTNTGITEEKEINQAPQPRVYDILTRFRHSCLRVSPRPSQSFHLFDADSAAEVEQSNILSGDIVRQPAGVVTFTMDHVNFLECLAFKLEMRTRKWDQGMAAAYRFPRWFMYLSTYKSESLQSSSSEIDTLRDYS